MPYALADGDVVVVTQKIVSKAEGAWSRSTPTTRAATSASSRPRRSAILRRRGDLVITETKHGFVCANAGVDLSNVERGWAALLPVDTDRRRRRIRDGDARAGAASTSA